MGDILPLMMFGTAMITSLFFVGKTLNPPFPADSNTSSQSFTSNSDNDGRLTAKFDRMSTKSSVTNRSHQKTRRVDDDRDENDEIDTSDTSDTNTDEAPTPVVGMDLIEKVGVAVESIRLACDRITKDVHEANAAGSDDVAKLDALGRAQDRVNEVKQVVEKLDATLLELSDLGKMHVSKTDLQILILKAKNDVANIKVSANDAMEKVNTHVLAHERERTRQRVVKREEAKNTIKELEEILLQKDARLSELRKAARGTIEMLSKNPTNNTVDKVIALEEERKRAVMSNDEEIARFTQIKTERENEVGVLQAELDRLDQAVNEVTNRFGDAERELQDADAAIAAGSTDPDALANKADAERKVNTLRAELDAHLNAKAAKDGELQAKKQEVIEAQDALVEASNNKPVLESSLARVTNALKPIRDLDAAQLDFQSDYENLHQAIAKLPHLSLRDHVDNLQHAIQQGGGDVVRAVVNRPMANIKLSDAIVYVMGDLEGQAHMLFKVLKDDLKIIEEVEHTTDRADRCASRCFKWTAPYNVYFVQCGDQIDAGGSRQNADGHLVPNASEIRQRNHPGVDLEVPLFTDYLQEISNGHFISIIGNHEWNNVLGEFHGVHPKNVEALGGEALRAKLFSTNEARGGLMAYIVRRRLFICRINNALFSHAGLTQKLLSSSSLLPHVENAPKNAAKLITHINAFLDDRDVFENVSDRFKTLVYNTTASDDNDFALTTTRHCKPEALSKLDGKEHASDSVFPRGFTVDESDDDDIVHINVTGHNKMADIGIHVVHAPADNHVVVTKPCPSDGSTCDVTMTLSYNEPYVVDCDSLPPTEESDKINMMEYATLTCLEKESQLNQLRVKSITCDIEACDLYPNLIQDYLTCNV